MTVLKFKKLPVEIEALRFLGGKITNATEVIDWVLSNGGACRYYEFRPERYASNGELSQFEQPEHILIETLEGAMRASVGDWVIKGVNGEFYPCKPDIFEKTYTQVED